ncbi:hypothetical protein [Streptomyces pini]|uniref:Uncharacterized protein n=1 Tax=Streptomyces pini TaxID=1520580 RepID=A0A1I4C3K3_9ACTN|nr:hypothetical protein [Streptomyces pini]SFK75190.1 hypothetical protein SAMN05192584_108229 [Streptomyces pini]
MSELPGFYDYKRAAELLAPVEESWLRNNIRSLPHSKIGGVVFFTDSDIAEMFRLFHIEPGGRKPADPQPAASGPHPLADVIKPRRGRARQSA